MTIPLDNLYHYIRGLFSDTICMYLFYPHGSRNILNIQGLSKSSDYDMQVLYPTVVCHDQEPLNFQLYQNHSDEVVKTLKNKWRSKRMLEKNDIMLSNLRAPLPTSLYDSIILIHSEKNSSDVDHYNKHGYVDVHYFCHAVIAKDWYRFAEYDPRLLVNQSTDHKKNFLIYCRDWSGSREYRLKFQELLHNSNIISDCVTSIKKPNNLNFANYTFNNPEFCPDRFNFLDYIDDNQHSSDTSASYTPEDFISTKISVILETVFDGNKIHLTEKTLRAIACGHPFILAAGPGSLEYLRSYGFKTFSPWIDESYDIESDGVNRLKKIIQSMYNFANLPAKKQQSIYNQIKKIADYNKQWFFSKNFTEILNRELVANISNALKQVKKTRARHFRSRTKDYKQLKKNTLDRNIIAHYLNNLRKLNPPE